MSLFHVSQRNALNQSLAEVQEQVNVLFEFLPPCTSGIEQTLWSSIGRPSGLKPKSVSVTYDANSGERDRTRSIIEGIKDCTSLEAAPHLTCIDATPTELQIIACGYWDNDTCHIVALRGGLPPRSDKPEMCASDLVTLLKEVVDLNISVAVYPEVYSEAKSTQADLFNLRRKMGAGASRVITQFLFGVGSYLHFRNRCVSIGIDVEIIPGILPVSNFKQAKEFADMTNICILAWMAQMLDGLDDDTETRKLMGVDIAVDMVKILSRGKVKDFHFHTLNRAEMSYTVYHTLGVRPGL